MSEDYVWTDGEREIATVSFDRAVTILEEAKCGKIWLRRFDGNLLEGVTDVTPKSRHRLEAKDASLSS